MSRRAPSPTPAGSKSAKPEKFELKADENKSNTFTFLFFSTVIPNLLVAGVTAYAVFNGGSLTSFSRKRVKTLVDRSLGPLLLGLWMLNLTHMMMQALIIDARGSTGCKAPNQHIYKVMSTGELVLMDEDGANGKFNRAQRGHANMAESAFVFLLAVLPIAYVFPWTAAVLVFMFAFTRWLFASSYTKKPEAREAGFALFFLVKETGFGMILFLGVYATWLEAKVHYPDLKLPEIPGLKFEF
jgi:uncharacterized membrane protein YecN with MAPEG domain